jgi:hypothetical protein
MSALPGLLIEYLVSGVLAFLWVRRLLPPDWVDKLGPEDLPILLVLLYVAGMTVDFAAWLVTRLPKRRVRLRILRKHRGPNANPEASGTARSAKITLHAPDLAKELAMRSSRDRIARGAFINACCAAFVLPWWIGLLAILGTFIMWAGFESLSYAFELCAEALVDENLAREADLRGKR